MPANVETTPPPRIGKIGPYTVFLSPPPSTPSTPSTPNFRPISDSPKKSDIPASPVASPPAPAPVQTHSPPPPPPVQAPPSQFYSSKPCQKAHSTFGFFWDAVNKFQNANARLDEHVAYWFGLDQSKYQWVLDDYYETKGNHSSRDQSSESKSS